MSPSKASLNLAFIPLSNRVPVKLSPTIVANGTNVGGKQTVNKGAIAGGVVSGIVLTSFFISGLLFLVRQRKRRSKIPTRIPALRGLAIEPFDTSTLSTSDPQSSTALTPHLVTNIHDTILAAPAAPFFIPQVSGLYEKQVRYGQRSDEARNAPTNFVEFADENRRGSVPSAGTSNVSPVNDPDLRRDLEDLRREVVRIRQEREVVDEAPPIYDYELENAMRR